MEEHKAMAKAGDICVLLVPSYDQSVTIRMQLGDLKHSFGGRVTDALHFCCQRFRASEEALEKLKPYVTSLFEDSEALPIRGTELEPFYSSFQEHELLKCRIDLHKDLAKFLMEFNTLLKALKLEPLCDEPPEHVTLLEGINIKRLKVHSYKRTLFIGQRLLLSKQIAPGRYEPLFSTSLKPFIPVSQLNQVRIHV